MTCPPEGQDLSTVYALMMLLIGLIVGNLTKRV